MLSYVLLCENIGGALGSAAEKSSSSLGGKGIKAGTGTGTAALSSSSSSSLSPEMDKLRICKEDFEAAKISFQQVTHHAYSTAQHSTVCLT